MILKAQKNEEKQKECFGGTTLLMIFISLLIIGLLLRFHRPLLELLGAKGEILRLTAEYIQVIALGTAFQLLATGFVPFIRNMGGSVFAMTAMMAVFASNIVLDYLFVWVCDYGMAGAAWATIIGQAITMLMAIVYLAVKKIGFYLPQVSAIPGFFGEILKVALAPFGLTFSPNITVILMNRFLLLYGNEQSIAVYSCIGYVTSISYFLLQGVGDGSQPLISKCYGKKDVNAVKRIRAFAYRTGAAVIAVCMVLLFSVRSKIGVLFGASSESCQEVAVYLPLFLSTMLFLSFVRITTSYFYATEKTGLSYILVYAEPVLLLLVLLAILPILKLNGVWIAVPCFFCLVFITFVVHHPVKDLRHFLRCFNKISFNPFVQQTEKSVRPKSALITFLCVCAKLRHHNLIESIINYGLQICRADNTQYFPVFIIKLKKVIGIINCVPMTFRHIMFSRKAIPKLH